MPPPNRDGTPVPASRLARLARLGAMATGVAGGMAAAGARSLASGKRPRLGDMLLTPANVARVADQLATMRGAAMKMGQLLSLDAGEFLPPELAAVLGRLRADAQPMPRAQLQRALDAAWGPGWSERFENFGFAPIAAASIGQVHRARTRDGRDLAIKVQYPGVRRSIDSDVDNVAALIRLSGLLPAAVDLAPMLDEAKRQLHEEADYDAEARHLRAFGGLLAGSPDFVVPTVDAELSTAGVLAMSYAGGMPVESLADASQGTRDRVATLLIGLVLQELFDFRLMQTDPNFANYRYDRSTGRVVLLDFGATRAFSDELATGYARLASAAVAGDPGRIADAAIGIGYFDADTAARHRDAIVEMIGIASEPLRAGGVYDFADDALLGRLRTRGMAFAAPRDFWHVPPVETLFLHRKIGGMYLLGARLRARVDVGALLTPYL